MSANTPTLRHGTFIKNVSVDERLRTRIPTGIDFVDEALGHGGFVPSNVMMLTGDPGVGKSTMVLQIANALHEAGHTCLLNTTEQAPENVQLMCERMDLQSGFFIGDDTSVAQMLSNANAIQKAYANKQFFLLIDSIPEMHVGVNDTNSTATRNTLECALAVRAWAKRTFGIVIFINHVTKGGVFMGSNKVLHHADQHAAFSFDKEKRSPTFGERIFRIGKNRWGTSGVTSILQMQEKGLVRSGRIMAGEQP